MGITLGDHSYGVIKPIAGDGEIIVGKFTSIAGEVKAFFAGDHNHNRISTFPFDHPGVCKISNIYPSISNMPDSINTNLPIRIGSDCWIGYGAILFRGVTIGDGAVIGAFTKVTKNIPPYAVVVGNSRIVKKRFSDEDIEFLLKFQWWNMKHKEIAKIIHLLQSSEINLLKEWAKENGKI